MKSCIDDPHSRCHKHIELVKIACDIHGLADTITMLNYGSRREAITGLVNHLMIQMEVNPYEILKKDIES